jgi:hypothetical protein
MSWSGTSSCHLWNIFSKESLEDSITYTELATSVSFNPDFSDNPPTPPATFVAI